jgi:hypothetical protein
MFEARTGENVTKGINMEPITPPEARELLGRLAEMEGDKLNWVIAQLKGHIEKIGVRWRVRNDVCGVMLRDEEKARKAIARLLPDWDTDPAAALALLCEVNTSVTGYEIMTQLGSAWLIPPTIPTQKRFFFNHDNTPESICLAVCRCWCAWRLNLIVEGETND